MTRALMVGALIAVAASGGAAAAELAGPYVGMDAGYGHGSAPGIEGNFLGIHGGYDIPVAGGGIIGFELAGDWQGQSWSSTYDDGGLRLISTHDDNLPIVNVMTTSSIGLNWSADLTVHVGIPAGPLMPYLLGGVGAGGDTLFLGFSSQSPAFSSSDTDTKTHVAAVAGIGLRALLMDHLSAFVEARYYGFNTASYDIHPTGGGGGASVAGAYTATRYGFSDAVIRTGLNFHFD